MNHAQIATEALRYRLQTVRGSRADHRSRDLESMASASVTAAAPEVDRAIRTIATAWVRWGLDPSELARPWHGRQVERLFCERPDLLDAIDDIIRFAARAHAA